MVVATIEQPTPSKLIVDNIEIFTIGSLSTIACTALSCALCLCTSKMLACNKFLVLGNSLAEFGDMIIPYVSGPILFGFGSFLTLKLATREIDSNNT